MQVNDQLHVFAWPAYSNKHLNPYNFILYTAIAKHDEVRVVDYVFNPKNFLRFWVYTSKACDIYHMHWPQSVFATQNQVKAIVNCASFCMMLGLLKVSRKKIVWTVHNLVAHENNLPRLRKAFDTLMYKWTDGFISMNTGGLTEINENAAKPESQQFTYIPHPHYRSYYPNTIARTEARTKLRIPAESFVYVFFGQIKTYKNVSGLIEAFKHVNIPNKYLVIAGKSPESLARDLTEKMAGCEDILFHPHFIRDEDIQLYLNSSNVMVTPYLEIFNSGSLFLNLSFNRPTIIPWSPAMEEVQSTVGTQWVITYENEFSAHDMEQVARAGTQIEDAVADLSAYEPDLIAEKTIAFYKSLARPA